MTLIPPVLRGQAPAPPWPPVTFHSPQLAQTPVSLAAAPQEPGFVTCTCNAQGQSCVGHNTPSSSLGSAQQQHCPCGRAGSPGDTEDRHLREYLGMQHIPVVCQEQSWGIFIAEGGEAETLCTGGQPSPADPALPSPQYQCLFMTPKPCSISTLFVPGCFTIPRRLHHMSPCPPLSLLRAAHHCLSPAPPAWRGHKIPSGDVPSLGKPVPSLVQAPALAEVAPELCLGTVLTWVSSVSPHSCSTASCSLMHCSCSQPRTSLPKPSPWGGHSALGEPGWLQNPGKAGRCVYGWPQRVAREDILRDDAPTCPWRVGCGVAAPRPLGSTS